MGGWAFEDHQMVILTVSGCFTGVAWTKVEASGTPVL